MPAQRNPTQGSNTPRLHTERHNNTEESTIAPAGTGPRLDRQLLCSTVEQRLQVCSTSSVWVRARYLPDVPSGELLENFQ